MYQIIEKIFEEIVHWAVLATEMLSAGILIFALIETFINLFRGKDDTHKLEHRFSLALTILLGGELLHSIVAESWDSLMMLAAVMALRMAVSLMLYWEHKHEK